ncbi:rhamnulokinase [Paenibacillus cymbidii]|uniref:rhamnulokinase n=1 Tax=Paenibacillus cymbidii TaxID=1639034 RepID=UPI0010818EE1|nr:rhamnulokinase [Paenibacillus cymbidii]
MSSRPDSGKESGATSVLAFDLGASSGRAIVGRLADGKLTMTEVHRFANEPVAVGHHLHWDILRLLHEIKQGLLKAKLAGYHDIDGIGIDSWAVDFGLLSATGELLGNPYHYRDRHTEGLIEEVCGVLGKERIYRSTGIQFLPFNTIYQLRAIQKAGNPILGQAKHLLMIAELLRYFLTGAVKSEYTIATHSQLLDATARTWDAGLLEGLGLPASIMPDIVEPGTIVGDLLPSICEELGVPSVPVIAVAEHDTASAVVAVPAAEGDFAYLSSGTWSLLGTELPAPVLTDEAMRLNFTNEGGVERTYRLLKNIMGLWLVQECRNEWEKEGKRRTFAELVKEGEQAEPFVSLIDPDHADFMNPPHMPRQIEAFCRATGQPVPETEGAMIRCVLESLALKYRMVLDYTERLSGRRFPVLHIVGGGSNNELLNQFTANAIGRKVIAGPTEGSAIGNIAVQLMALGALNGLAEARAVIRDSFPLQAYEPRETEAWTAAYERFRRLVG